MSNNYTHEGTVVLSGSSVMVYHSGDTILTMYDPHRNRWSAQKRWDLQLVDGKTPFDHKGFMMFDWHDIVSKELAINKEFSVNRIDMERLVMGARYANAVVRHHDYLVDKDTVGNYDPIKCVFDANSIEDIYVDGVKITVPNASWKGVEFNIRKASKEELDRSTTSWGKNLQQYDPDLKDQEWVGTSMEQLHKVWELYKQAIPNIPVRKRGKRGV
jgi:hypothetical protein